MDEKRKGEIALVALKYIISREGVRLNPDMMREVGNKAKAIGVPHEELKQFYKIILQELFETAFGERDLKIS